ncbi:tail assembly chaperone [Mycobacterium phage Courthouse]|uniref:Tail assembly chaperone n=2 Tax=Omegavirus courthouse TaxID=1089119 RepID=G8I587_9CAUD|nr:tail assembly chaperone [Mycobacterium phage Courthouse]AER47882.1 tail assembly chaperone [Mycobacterium phage Courthouse]
MWVSTAQQPLFFLGVIQMTYTPRKPVSVREAKEQAAEYFGFTASVEIEINGEIFEIPNPGLLDDDQQERWEELQFRIEKCDREDDVVVPPMTLEDGTELPGRTIKGELKTPYQINGELMKPPYNVQLAQAIFGEEKYERFKAGGGRSNQIPLEWARMNREFQERVDADPKVREAMARWMVFPREIECDLSLYHNHDIGEWYRGELSSRKLLILLDGLPEDSWYKLSVHAYLKEVQETFEKDTVREVKRSIFAQLTGQEMG